MDNNGKKTRTIRNIKVDTKKCAGCTTCMMTCSMVHYGKSSLSTSRIQIVQTALAPFPLDLDIYQCRQCTDPLCVTNCPVGAAKLDVVVADITSLHWTPSSMRPIHRCWAAVASMARSTAPPGRNSSPNAERWAAAKPVLPKSHSDIGCRHDTSSTRSGRYGMAATAGKSSCWRPAIERD